MTSSDAPGGKDARLVEAGLCADCRHAQQIKSSRGSVFYRCQYSDVDPAYPKYPRLPVLRCAAYRKASTTVQLLSDQIAYYRARAREYDEWFLREGRYDRGAEHRREWFEEVERVRSVLIPEIPQGPVLEFACGTGLWTQLLAQHATRVMAVDASPEVIALNRERVRASTVEYVDADIFSWHTEEQFDLIFFAFWLSHVPPERFDAFWTSLGDRLKSGGRVFFVDSLLEQDSTAKDHPPLNSSGIVTRRLNDGREFDIVKVFYEPDALRERLRRLGWDGNVQTSGRFFIFGSVRRAMPS